MANTRVNGIKTISNLAAATVINDADVFLIEVGGVTKKVTGATIKTLITATAPAVDSTLSIEGAAADADATGDAIQAIDLTDRVIAGTGTKAVKQGDLTNNTASGDYSSAHGSGTIANHAYQQVFGEYNVADASAAESTARGNYIEIVGNGTVDLTDPSTPVESRSNARTLDWNGNEVLAGTLAVGRAPTSNMEVATKQYVDSELSSAASGMIAAAAAGAALTTITISDTDVTIVGVNNCRYMCGTVDSISITPPQEGMIDVVFTSGSTAAVLTLPSTVKMPEWFDATALETDTVYEICITDAVYGTVMTWQA